MHFFNYKELTFASNFFYKRSGEMKIRSYLIPVSGYKAQGTGCKVQDSGLLKPQLFKELFCLPADRTVGGCSTQNSKLKTHISYLISHISYLISHLTNIILRVCTNPPACNL